MKIFRFLCSKSDLQILLISFLLISVFSVSSYVKYAHGEAETLTLTVLSSLTFSATTDNFGSITPGTAKFATSTLLLATNNTSGWNVVLSGDDVTTPGGNTACDLDSDASVGIVDQLQWVAPAATTTAGNAVRISSFTNSGNVLAFRVMTASGTSPFRSSTWWGTTDSYVDAATTLWAGIASSTVSRQIGNAGAGSYSASTQLSSVLYYLNVSATQQTGAYSCPLTYTATANP